MIKLITPLGMLFTVAMMAVLAVYAFWTSHVDRSSLYFGLGIVSIVACVGVALLRAWSQYLVYSLSAAFVAAWFHSVYKGAAAGYFVFSFPPGWSLPRLCSQGSRWSSSRSLQAGSPSVTSAACGTATDRSWEPSNRGSDASAPLIGGAETVACVSPDCGTACVKKFRQASSIAGQASGADITGGFNSPE